MKKALPAGAVRMAPEQVQMFFLAAPPKPPRAPAARKAKSEPPKPREPWIPKEGVGTGVARSLKGQKLARQFASQPITAVMDKRVMITNATPIKGVGPADRKERLAMDSAIDTAVGFAWGGAIGGAYNWIFEQGYGFLGYPALSQMAQIAEFRLISETISTEATRKWIKIKSQSDDGEKSDKIKELEAEFERLDVRGKFRKLALDDGFFGRAHLYIDTGGTDDPSELLTPIGDGNKFSKKKFRKGFLSDITVVEPIWCYPQWYNADDPLKPTFYKPDVWYVMAKGVHVSRLLLFCSKPVPDIIKPAFCFGGLSMTQMALPYVQNWLETRQNVNNIIQRFSQFVLKTDLQTLMQKDGAGLMERVQSFVEMASVNNLLMLNKETEDFGVVTATLASLDKLQAQAQEHMASVSKIPLVKLTGISPTGLNASSEGELECFDDTIHAHQENFFEPHLGTVFKLAQINIWGEVDPDLVYDFLPLSELSEKDIADLQKTRSDTHKNYVDMGAIDRSEVRQAVADDAEGPYSDLDVDDLPELEVEPENLHEKLDDDITGEGAGESDKDEGDGSSSEED